MCGWKVGTVLLNFVDIIIHCWIKFLQLYKNFTLKQALI